VNRNDYAPSLFEVAQHLPYCPFYGSASRTWMYVIDADNPVRRITYCGIWKPATLRRFGFYAKIKDRPKALKIELVDQIAGRTVVSNVVTVPLSREQ
jgi:hypothetical protein